MKKVTIAGALVLAGVALAGCTSPGGGDDETTRLAQLTAESICLMNEAFGGYMDDMETMASMTPEEQEARAAEIEAVSQELPGKLEALPTKYGFADDAAIQASLAAIADQEAFRTQVGDLANAQCSPNAEMLEMTLQGFLAS